MKVEGGRVKGLLVYWLVWACGSMLSVADRPNVIVIFCDDMCSHQNHFTQIPVKHL